MYEEQLARVALFHDLSRREVRSVSVACHERRYAPNDPLIRQGEPSAGLFILVSGSVRLTQRGDDGSEHELSQMGAGEVLGGMSVLDEYLQPASAIALEPTEALVIPRWDFYATVREDPDVGIKLLAVLSRRLRQAEPGNC